jgi:universal stress protein A
MTTGRRAPRVSPATLLGPSRHEALAGTGLVVKRILAPTDFSRASLKAVAYAGRIARILGAELTLLYVADMPYAAADLESPATVERVLEQGYRAARLELAALRTELAKLGVAAHALHRKGAAGERILEVTHDKAIDWIVMATHGRTDSARAFLGSVTEAVIQSAPCPVLAIPRNSLD